MTPSDVLVLGKGPAGLAAAAALAERGLRVMVAGPPGPVRWPAQYAAWEDELGGVGLRRPFERVWPEARADFGPGQSLILDRPYGRVDKYALGAWLEARCEAAGVGWQDAIVASADHDRTGTTVRTREGGTLRATLVVDATGHRPALVRRAVRPPQGFQTALGLTLGDTSLGELDPDRALLMDWNDAHLAPDDPAPRRPTFLYAMPFGDGRLFVEETSLVSRPALPMEILDARLRRRLSHLGVRGRETAREACWIPMGGALPNLRQRVVGFGGAGGMVHPATGYLLPRVLHTAPRLAASVAESLSVQGADPARAARRAWLALWPPDRQRRHALLCFGMETLLRLDAEGIRTFFHAFFHLPESAWRGYMGDALSARRLAGVMARLYGRASNSLRRDLSRAGPGPAGARLASSLLRSGYR